MRQAPNNTLWQSYKNLTTFVEGYGKKHQAQYLVPLRLFIGLGWIRAGLEKLFDNQWLDGYKLLAFFEAQIVGNQIPFPAYQTMIEGVFSQHTIFMSWLIAIGELLVGIAIFTGTLTSTALLTAMFLNMNFMLAGSVNPSAFYLIIEMVLLQSRAGQFWGLDWWFSQKFRLLSIYPSYVRFRYNIKKMLKSRYSVMAQVALCGGACLAFVPFIRTVQPVSCLQNIGFFLQQTRIGQCVDIAGSIHDSAIFLSMLCGFTALSTILRVFERSKT